MGATHLCRNLPYCPPPPVQLKIKSTGSKIVVTRYIDKICSGYTVFNRNYTPENLIQKLSWFCHRQDIKRERFPVRIKLNT